MGDMQISSQYVAYSIHMISSLAGGAQTAIVSHSQGGPDTQWALRFWPSTQKLTRAFVALSPDFAGIQLLGSNLSDFCVGKLCQASIWQQSAGSNYLTAMHDDTFQEMVPTTTIWTQFDGIVNPPQSNAQLPGATAVSVQGLCPGRMTTHVFMTIDAAAYALALDALNHGGIASISRARSTSWLNCLMVAGPHMSAAVATELQDGWNTVVDGIM